MKHKLCAFALMGLLGLVAVRAQQQAQQPSQTQQQQDIVEVASANDNFSTLVTALRAADLVDTLKGAGPFTVFAPTNEAFAALPQGTLDRLLQEEHKDTLVAILKYHVVPSRVMAVDVKAGEVKTVQGKNLNIQKQLGNVTIGQANVTQTDLAAKNGVIHVIDKVLIPEGVTLPRDT
jgi:uncharacterized surface protein with fasciclin (FAS1) repeats